jgi:hypothetical protein
MTLSVYKKQNCSFLGPLLAVYGVFNMGIDVWCYLGSRSFQRDFVNMG